MSGAKDEILAKISRTLTHSAQSEYQSIERNYCLSGTLDLAERVRLLENRLLDYGATIHHCAAQNIAQSISAVLLSRGIESILIPSGLPSDWLSPAISFVRDEELSNSVLNASKGVLTTCALAIAETGTVVLRHSREEGRRVLTLIPDYHLCVVRYGQIVESVVEGIRQIRAWSASPITTISGPSATSDIEMTRIRGVHGPRTLELILMSES